MDWPHNADIEGGSLVAFAAEQGATIVEGYPVDGERTSVVDYFTGTIGMFTRRGFDEIERRNATRPIVRLELG